jgi:hypothetical protein
MGTDRPAIRAAGVAAAFGIILLTPTAAHAGSETFDQCVARKVSSGVERAIAVTQRPTDAPLDSGQLLIASDDATHREVRVEQLPLGGGKRAEQAEHEERVFAEALRDSAAALNSTLELDEVLDRLLAKGIILQQGDARYVLCTLDWCELCNDSDLRLRTKLAEAARTTADRVAIHTVHQHAAPYADHGAHRYLDEGDKPVLHLSDAFLDSVADSLALAARQALGRLSEFDRIGTSQARVDRIASTRRLRNAAGGITTRYSTGAKSRALADAPEGDIDPFLKTITLARGDRPLVRLHFYATHPQTFACDGRASSDFPGIAREAMQKQEGVFQIYLTGCAGDVTAGKNTDGSDASRDALAGRLLEAMKSSVAATRYQPIQTLAWRSAELKLTPREEPRYSREALLARIRDPQAAAGVRVYDSAIRLAFIDRQDRPSRVNALELGGGRILRDPRAPPGGSCN